MKKFKVEALGDMLYIKANDEAGALKTLTAFAGDIPHGLLRIVELPKKFVLPAEEEWL